MKLTCNSAMLSRVLIAILFVFAGVGKIMTFQAFVDQAIAPKFPMASLIAVLVILVEIPNAILFAIGYKTKITGMLLAGFTALTIIFYHNPWATGVFDPNMAIMALKNIAIIGGILAASRCFCDKCKM